MAVDQRSLPAGGQRLLALAAAVPEQEAARHRDARLPWLTRIGTAVRAGWEVASHMLGFIGEPIPADLRLMAGTARQGEREIMGNKISPTMIGAFVVGAI